jgi:hypothetical protein
VNVQRELGVTSGGFEPPPLARSEYLELVLNLTPYCGCVRSERPLGHDVNITILSFVQHYVLHVLPDDCAELLRQIYLDALYAQNSSSGYSDSFDPSTSHSASRLASSQGQGVQTIDIIARVVSWFSLSTKN